MFAVVALINVPFENGFAPVSTCSLCDTNSMLPAYIKGNWSQATSSPFEESMLYSCKHINAVVSWVTHKVIPENERPEDSSLCYAETIASLLSSYMINAPEVAIPGTWILTNVNYTFKSGRLMFYLSEF
jgi:hypothetical protein